MAYDESYSQRMLGVEVGRLHNILISQGVHARKIRS
jgi:hypothetical protein